MKPFYIFAFVLWSAWRLASSEPTARPPLCFCLVHLLFLVVELFCEPLHKPRPNFYRKVVSFNKTPPAMVFEKKKLFIDIFYILIV